MTTTHLTRTYETVAIRWDREDASGRYASTWTGYDRESAAATIAFAAARGGHGEMVVSTFDVTFPADQAHLYQPGIAERVAA